MITEDLDTRRHNVVEVARVLYRAAQRDTLTAPAAYGIAVALIQHGLGLTLADACHIMNDVICS